MISLTRRTLIKSATFGLLSISLPNIIYAKQNNSEQQPADLFHRYPAIDDTIVAEVVGVSHFNLDRLKELVNRRPELARATWDWGFGDWETAIGAASHTGRRDIAEYLISKGARPDIFTFAMLGAFPAVKAMVDASPGIQAIAGPHGISLLQHARNGARADGLTDKQAAQSTQLIHYLESLGNADAPEYAAVTDAEKEKYMGDYKYGDGPDDGFSIKLNMRKILSFGKLGKNGGALYRKAGQTFIYNGTTSVEIIFTLQQDKVISLTIHEPDLTLVAKKI
jgi:hypothetical protein